MQIITYIIYNRSVTREQLYEMFWPEYELQKTEQLSKCIVKPY